MRHRQLLGTMLIAASTLTVAACGSSGSSGGGGSIPSTPQATPTATPTPGPGQATAQQQSPVSSTSGGTVSASLPNNGTLSVSVPANALAGNATITVYAYTSASQMPGSPFGTSSASAGRRPASSSTKLPSGAVFLAGFAVDDGGVASLAPLAVSETLQTSVPSGDVVRVARYGTAGWTDVDTATVKNDAAVNDQNAKYVSVTPGGSANPYLVYAVPAASAAAPSKLSIKSSTSGSLAIGQSATFTTSGADTNGNPLPFTPAFDTDNHALATVRAIKGSPLSVNVTASTQGGTLHLLSTDSRTGTVGMTPVTVLTQRPSNSGDTFAFSGTLTQSDVYSYPTPNPIPADSKTANVAQTVTVTATADPYGSGTTVQDFNVKEQDAFSTQTLSSTTDSYFQVGAAANNASQYVLLGFNSTDDQGNTASTHYASPGILVDELPEASGQSWSNSPAMTLSENYADLESVKRTVNSDGSYTDSENMYNAPLPSPSPGAPTQDYPNMTLVTNGFADGHATLNWQFPISESWASQIGAPAGTIVEYDMAATAPGSNGIQFMSNTGWFPSLGQQQSPFTNNQAVPVWYPALNGSLYSETDKNLGSVSIPTSCHVPSSFGTSANQLEQKTSSIDPMMGTLETVQTDQYVVTGSGPVCVTVTDVTNQYYNYQFDQAYTGYFDYYPVLSGAPLVVTTVSETLALQSATVSSQSRTRNAMSGAPGAAIPPVAVALARQHVQHVMHHTMAVRRVQAIHRMALTRGKGAQH